MERMRQTYGGDAMKKLHFDYRMQIDYTIEVSTCNFTIKCIPKNDARQTIKEMHIELDPNTHYNWGNDGLGNTQIYGLNELPHRSFSFHIWGEADAGLSDYEEEVDDRIAMIFRHPYGMNRAGDGIRAYYDRMKDLPEDAYEKATELMHRLYRDLVYQPGTTTVTTTAEEAFSLGCGVCQDYAHIFIALLHLAGIPARYVTGLIVGEGASHAWVELLYNNHWYGLDPTNDKPVFDEHIKIGIGRDAHDCMINRGIMHGGGLHTQTITANVWEYPTKFN